jgi:transcription elongation factor Elf1
MQTKNKATGPGMCPKCGSTKVDDCGQDDYDGEIMTCLSKCKNCDTYFWESYTMTWAASSYNEEE